MDYKTWCGDEILYSMNNLQLSTLMYYYDKSVADSFRSVLPIDNFVRDVVNRIDVSSQNTFIVNTKQEVNKREPGHWLFVQVGPSSSGGGGDLEVIYFDSFAKPSEFYGVDFQETLVGLCVGGQIQTSPFRVQSNRSNLCGVYCLFVAYNLKLYANNLSTLISSVFRPDALLHNDEKLLDWVATQPFHYIFKSACAKEKEMCVSYAKLFGEQEEEH